ncbi:transposable element Tcb2 transposase [Trichonephila clavipes]|nr:transposable element Tcb2 transposase [Trichonephila clavipes]
MTFALTLVSILVDYDQRFIYYSKVRFVCYCKKSIIETHWSNLHILMPADTSFVLPDPQFSITAEFFSNKLTHGNVLKMKRTRVPLLAGDLSAVSGRRVSRKTVYRRLAETGLYAQRSVLYVPLTASNRKDLLSRSRKHQSWEEWGHVVFSDESKCTRRRDSRRVFTWRENEACFHLSYVTKIDRFGAKVILVCDGIMLGNHIPLYAFNVCTFNLKRYRDKVLEAYVKLF